MDNPDVPIREAILQIATPLFVKSSCVDFHGTLLAPVTPVDADAASSLLVVVAGKVLAPIRRVSLLAATVTPVKARHPCFAIHSYNDIPRELIQVNSFLVPQPDTIILDNRHDLPPFSLRFTESISSFLVHKREISSTHKVSNLLSRVSL